MSKEESSVIIFIGKARARRYPYFAAVCSHLAWTPQELNSQGHRKLSIAIWESSNVCVGGGGKTCPLWLI